MATFGWGWAAGIRAISRDLSLRARRLPGHWEGGWPHVRCVRGPSARRRRRRGLDGAQDHLDRAQVVGGVGGRGTVFADRAPEVHEDGRLVGALERDERDRLLLLCGARVVHVDAAIDLHAAAAEREVAPRALDQPAAVPVGELAAGMPRAAVGHM